MAGLAFLASGLSAGSERVIVTPRCLTLLSGETCAFRARRAGEPAGGPREEWRWSLADGGEGAIIETTGVYRAPDVTGIRRIRVRAAPVADGKAEPGEASVTILPAKPFDLVGRIMGADWLEPFSQDCPFLDLETGRRFPGTSPAREVRTVQHGSTRLLTGYGLPAALSWRPDAKTVAQMLSFREGNQVVRRDVTGQTAWIREFRGPVRNCSVEALELVSGAEGRWISRSHSFEVDVRGVLPFAGNPLADGEHADGRGLSARFRQAFAAVWLWQRDAESGTWGTFHVSDPDAHVLRLVSQEGRVTTLCGEPGQAGHQDSPGWLERLKARFWFTRAPAARFNRPTYLARREVPSQTVPPFSCWETLVADSGNHALRRVDEEGRVATLAGVPGRAGHRDHPDPRAALFDDPQGLAADSRSWVYVADRGNHVIRRIHSGGVTTVAGSPRQPGTRDGADARFKDLKGLAWAPGPGPDGDLFVLDGHAVRRIRLEDRVVTTLVGQVDQPGFQDARAGGGPAALLQPCLRDPAGILHDRDGTLLLADRGNRAIRRVNLENGSLITLAGDPAAPEHRWGLLRDGVPGPLGPAYAALEGPTAVTLGTQRLDGYLVCSGRTVAALCDRGREREIPAVSRLDVSAARQDEPAAATFSLETVDSQGWPTMRAFRYTVDFLDPSGDLAERHQGEASSIAPVTVAGTFTASGKARVLVQCCTDQGVSAGAQAEVPVAP